MIPLRWLHLMTLTYFFNVKKLKFQYLGNSESQRNMFLEFLAPFQFSKVQINTKLFHFHPLVRKVTIRPDFTGTVPVLNRLSRIFGRPLRDPNLFRFQNLRHGLVIRFFRSAFCQHLSINVKLFSARFNSSAAMDDKWQYSSYEPLPSFSRSNNLNVNISETVRTGAKRHGMIFVDFFICAIEWPHYEKLYS